MHDRAGSESSSPLTGHRCCRPGPARAVADPGRAGFAGRFLAVFWLAACAALLFLLCTSCSKPLELVIYDSGNEAVLARVPVDPEDVFTLSYRHSVSNSMVKGTFACTAEGQIRPLTTTFLSFGPGLPLTGAETGGTVENGKIVVRHSPELREEIRLWASLLTEERLAVGGRVLDLFEAGGDPRLVIIFLARRGSGYSPPN